MKFLIEYSFNGTRECEIYDTYSPDECKKHANERFGVRKLALESKAKNWYRIFWLNSNYMGLPEIIDIDKCVLLYKSRGCPRKKVENSQESTLEPNKKKDTLVIEKRVARRCINYLKREFSFDQICMSQKFPPQFDIFDVLSILVQEFELDDIGPLLDSAISDLLVYEAEKESNFIEKASLMQAFREILDSHFKTKKIQNYIHSKYLNGN